VTGLDATEAGLRLALWEAALERDAARWELGRLVLADWLEEHGRSQESAACRLGWCCWRSHPAYQTYHIPREIRWWDRARLAGALNGAWLLGFPPRTLKLLSRGGRLVFTWAPARKNRRGRLDTEALPGGFLAVLAPPAGPGRSPGGVLARVGRFLRGLFGG
jgi:hypothetical protein